MPSPAQSERFARALAALEAELDWARLGRAACEGDGTGFYDPALRERIVDVGLQLFDRLAGDLPAGGPGRSLYVGASVAEVAPILAEHLVLEREVLWLELAGEATDELARALGAVGVDLGLTLPAPSTTGIELVARGSCDHLWMVSVLSDPEAFPALHDALYERGGGPLATGRGDLGAERARAETLVDGLLARATPRALLTTTDEELELVGPRAAAHGATLEVSDGALLSAVVGDRVRSCRLERSVP